MSTKISTHKGKLSIFKELYTLVYSATQSFAVEVDYTEKTGFIDFLPEIILK
jgi:hypothetical protein